MKTITTKVYSFNELSETAKETAIEIVRDINNRHGNDFYSDEIIKSIEAMANIFNFRFGREYTDIRTSHIDDNILQLTGIRLHTYIVNNYWHSLYKGKYFSLWSKTEKSYKYHKEGYPVLKSRYSKVIFNNSCVLTGVCYDDDILQPIYDFLANPHNTETFEGIINKIEHAIQKCFDGVEKWINSDEYITEQIEANEYEFLENGKLF